MCICVGICAYLKTCTLYFSFSSEAIQQYFFLPNLPIHYWLRLACGITIAMICTQTAEKSISNVLSSFSPSLSVSSLAKATICLAYTSKCKCLQEQACNAFWVPRDVSLASFWGHRQLPYHRFPQHQLRYHIPVAALQRQPESLSHWFAMCSALIRIYRVIQKMMTV